MQPLGVNALFYLAASVSDFFAHAERMVEHKIQSSEDFGLSATTVVDGAREPAAYIDGKSLIIDLNPVPKFL